MPSAIQGLTANQIYRAPGAVAYFDEPLVRGALAPNMRVLVGPFTGANYANSDQHATEVYEPLSQWAEDTKTTLIEVDGLSVSSYSGGAYGPSDIPELRQQTAHYDVTSAVLGMINYAKTGAKSSPSQPADPVVPPTPDQVAALAARLRTNPVYNAPGRTDPLVIPTDLLTRTTGLTVRVAAFPTLAPGAPLVDYAPALAKEFPGDTVFVSYGMWLDVAGPEQQILESARDYAYGRFETGTFEQGLNMSDRIGTIATRVADLLQRRPFARPQPTFDLRHTISDVAPWVLLGSALVLGGGSLLSWSRRRSHATRAEKSALQRETALTAAAIADLNASVLAATKGSPEQLAAAAERHSTAIEMFDRAHTADAMREVRAIAEQGEVLLSEAGNR